MTKYLIPNCSKILCDDVDKISIHPSSNEYIRRCKNWPIYMNASYRRNIKNYLILVIEDEDILEFDFLDEYKNYNNCKNYSIMDHNGELQQIEILENKNPYNVYIKINNETKYYSHYPFEFVIFKNCKNLKKITGIIETFNKISEKNSNIIPFQYLIWNCPNYTFEFKNYSSEQLAFYNNNSGQWIGGFEIIFLISNNFKIILNFDDPLLQKINITQYEKNKFLENKCIENSTKVNILQNEIKHKNEEIDILKNKLKETEEKLNKLDKLMTLIIKNINVDDNEIKYSFFN